MENYWDHDLVEAEKALAEARVDDLATARKLNDGKARRLVFAMMAQAMAITAVSVVAVGFLVTAAVA